MKKVKGVQNVSVQIEDFIVEKIKTVKGRTMAEFIRRAILQRLKWVMENGEKSYDGRICEPYWDQQLDDFRRELKHPTPVPATGKKKASSYR